MFPAWTMKVAAALHTVKQHSRLGCLLTGLRPVDDTSDKSGLRAWMKYLSENWYPCKESQSGPVQTMRVAAALHTSGQRQTGCLRAMLRAVRAFSKEKRQMFLTGHTCQMVAMHVEEAQGSQHRPCRWQLPCTPSSSTHDRDACSQVSDLSKTSA